MKVMVSFFVVTLMSGLLLAEERKGDVRTIGFSMKPDDSTIVKFEFVDRSLIVIPVFVNGSGPYKFLLDTGAGITVLSRALANKLNLRDGRTDSMHSAGGSVIVRIRTVDTLQVGDIRIRQPEVAIADFGAMKTLKVDGILGGDRLKFFSVSIDYAKQLVRIERA